MTQNPEPEQQQPNTKNNNDPLKGYAAIYKTVTAYADLSDGAFRTYATLLGHDLGNGVFPSIETLARERHISHRAAQAHVLEIRRAGLVTVTRRGLGKTNVYEIVDGKTWTPAAPDVQDSAHQQIGKILHIKKCNDAHLRSADSRTSHREETVGPKKQKREVTVGVGADKPRRAPDPDLERISTEHDPDAPACRRLSLDLARTILDWDTVGAGTLRRLDGYYKARLEQPHDPRYDDAETRLMAFNEWLESNGYWAEHAHMFNDAQMSKEWNDWVGKGEPKRKPCPKGQVRR